MVFLSLSAPELLRVRAILSFSLLFLVGSSVRVYRREPANTQSPMPNEEKSIGTHGGVETVIIYS